MPALVDPYGRQGNYSVTSSNGLLTVTAGPPPTFTSITPSKGQTNGGTAVTITGSGFELGAGVLFARPTRGLGCHQCQWHANQAPSRHLVCWGFVSLVLTNPDSTSATLTNGFTYTGPPPAIVTQPDNLTVSLGGYGDFPNHGLVCRGLPMADERRQSRGQRLDYRDAGQHPDHSRRATCRCWQL